MNNKINILARKKRLKRIISNSDTNNFNFIKFKYTKFTKSYTFVLVFVTFFMPFYPRFASLAYNNNQYDFIRNEIDESSIIWSYYADYNESYSDSPILESADSFLSINNILDDKRDLAWTNEIINYEIQPWDSISTIAYNFKVSNNSIYWANNFTKDHIIHPWDILKVPPTSWLIHQVQSWDTISTIAKKYEVASDKILEQNLLTKDDIINLWDILVIPWAIKKIIKPIVKPIITKNTKTGKSSRNTISNIAKSNYVSDTWAYNLVRRQPSHSFYWWNCTRYVWQYKNVTWWWDAKEWYDNASDSWYATWKTPSLWSIVVFDWRWYNPRYWHVWIVMDIKWSDIIISDMNYRRLNEVTYRRVPISDRAIKWYIYVN